MAKYSLAPILFLFVCMARAEEIPNRLIDYGAFSAQVAVVGELRAAHRVTEDEFIRMSADPATVILDARSHEKFELLHIKGAKNLSLPDITQEELAKVIPSKSTRILIYCNNNFLNEPRAFPSKVLSAYGYTNVYELGPLIDIRTAKIPFERSNSLALLRQ